MQANGNCGGGKWFFKAVRDPAGKGRGDPEQVGRSNTAKHSMKYKGITLHSAGQLWSNVALRDQDAGIPAMLSRPSFLDLVRLSVKFSPAKLLEENEKLFSAGLISKEQYEITVSMLENIERGLSAR